MSEPTMDEIRQIIADEWGSHLCYYDDTGYPRNCNREGFCRCADIAKAILANYELKLRTDAVRRS